MNKLARYIIIAVGTALGLFLAWYFSNILTYILISAVVSLIGRPLVNALDRLHIGARRFPHVLSALLTVIILWAVFLLFFFVMSPLIANLVDRLSTITPDQFLSEIGHSIDRVQHWIMATIPGMSKDFNLHEVLKGQFSNIINQSTIVGIFGSVANMLVSVGVGVFAVTFITFFFLKEDNLFFEGVIMLFPSKYEENARHALSSITHLLIRYFIGIFADMCCVMTLLTIGLTFIAGLPFQTALVLGFLGGILNMIPYIGPLISLLFGCAIGIATTFGMSDVALPFLLLKMAACYIGINMIDAALFQPFIYSNSIKAHPLEIFLVILTAGGIAGVFGMILAIPTYMVVRVFAKEFFNQFRLVQKLTEKI